MALSLSASTSCTIAVTLSGKRYTSSSIHKRGRRLPWSAPYLSSMGTLKLICKAIVPLIGTLSSGKTRIWLVSVGGCSMDTTLDAGLTSSFVNYYWAFLLLDVRFMTFNPALFIVLLLSTMSGLLLFMLAFPWWPWLMYDCVYWVEEFWCLPCFNLSYSYT